MKQIKMFNPNTDFGAYFRIVEDAIKDKEKELHIISMMICIESAVRLRNLLVEFGNFSFYEAKNLMLPKTDKNPSTPVVVFVMKNEGLENWGKELTL